MVRPAYRIAVAAAFLTALSPHAHAFDREHASTFAVLPDGATGPEGIEVDRAGNVYVATFGFNAQGAVSGEGKIHVFDRGGKLERTVSVKGSTSHLLGLAFHPQTGDLLVIDFGAGNVLKVDPFSGASSVFMTVTGSPGLNDLTFDKAGNVYVSDSFQGIIWKTDRNGGAATAWVTSPLLTTTGIPPFGANGLRFNNGETALFVANTGNDTIVKIPVAGGTPGAPAVLTNSINGADGLVIDEHDNLWVVANQSDEIVVVDPGGRVLAKLGDFDGVRNGAPVGMLFPASLRFSGDSLLVTNLSLDGRIFGFTTIDSEWCAQITRYTVVKVPAHIPPIQGLPR
jgi:sugar lactone lactonase YvrE